MSSKDKHIVSGTAEVLAGCQGGQLAETSNPRRRSGKELCEEMGTDAEKKAMVISKAKTRGAARVRFLAVGLFLSVLTVSSEQLIKIMKNIWKIRGVVDMSPMEGRRFVLEFAEEGDFPHVTRGGPWRYREDAVLIEALKEGEDPDAVNFKSVPIWVQFKEIPFYLLSKELSRDLGKRMGELIFIDNDSRGDLLAKFLRARVRLPLDTPLLRWAKLMDEIANEEVVASVFYERLPTFYKCCGIIGHQAANCSLPTEKRSNNYEPELGVPPTHYKDTPRWFLPETTGQERRPLYKFLAWDNVSEPAAPPNLLMRQRHLAIVSHVAKEVGKLTVNEPATMTKAREEQTAASSPTVSVASKQLCYEVQTKAPNDTNTVVPHEAHGEAVIDNQAEAPLHNEVQAKATGDTNTEVPHEEQGDETIANSVAFLQSYCDIVHNEVDNDKEKGNRTDDSFIKTNDVSAINDRALVKEIIRWQPPPMGAIKVNVDASYCHVSGEAAVGAVVRNHQDQIVLASRKVIEKCQDPEEAEACAILEGLMLAIDNNLEPNSVESDCANAVSNVHRNTGKHSKA
ncbi:hypothetical protein ACQ4PT_069231 [Festuca glaucescens]